MIAAAKSEQANKTLEPTRSFALSFRKARPTSNASGRVAHLWRSAKEDMASGIPELIAADDEQPFAPSGFDRVAATATFTSFACDVQKLFPSAMSEVREDTAFHGQIAVEVPPGFAVIRASNFGRFISIFPMGDPLPEHAIGALIELFAKHQYSFVSADVLQHSYAGLARGDYATWLERFFGSK